MSLGETLWTLINKQALNYVLASKQRCYFPAFPALSTFPGATGEGRNLCWQPVLPALQHWLSRPRAATVGFAAGSVMAAVPLLPIRTQATPRDGDSAREVQVNLP